MSKGSRPRPFDYAAFSQNYDKIFGKERKNNPEQALEELVAVNEELGLYDDMWYHMCPEEGHIGTGKGEECSWCGKRESK